MSGRLHVFLPLLAILGATALGGVFSALAHPRRIGWAGDWGQAMEHRARSAQLRVAEMADVLQAMTGKSAFLLDARREGEYRTGHLPTALSLPDERREDGLAGLQGLLAPADVLMVYCNGRFCDEGLLLAVFLRQQGYTNLWLFTGGMEDWRKAGRRVETGP